MLLNKTLQTTHTGVTDQSISMEYPNHYKYVYIGHDESFTFDELNYELFTTPRYLKYFRNVFRIYSAEENVNFNFQLYYGSYGNHYIALYTPTTTKYLFGQQFNNEHSFAYLDLDNNQIIAENETRDRKPGNEYRPVYYRNKQINDRQLILVFNALTISTIVPFYEKLLNPFSFVSGYQYIYQYLLDHDEMEFYPSSYIPTPLPKHYTIYKPKVMVMVNSVFYTWDGTQFNVYNPTGTYLTVNELNTHGISLDEYNLIPKDKFVDLLNKDLFGSKIQIITNGYVLPTIVESTYWLDKYDAAYFLWKVSRKQKVLFIPGMI